MSVGVYVGTKVGVGVGVVVGAADNGHSVGVIVKCTLLYITYWNIVLCNNEYTVN